MSPPPVPLYAIACADALGPAAVPAAVEAMARAGIPWIQLRLKSGDDRDRCAVVEATLERLGERRRGLTLWIDDRPDLGRCFGFDGVHVGQTDLPPAAVRRVVGAEVRIGLSCHSPDQVVEAEADPAVDVVACGPVYPTRSKAAPDPVVGPAGVAAARARTRKPLVAIGGIDAGRLPAVLEAGADLAVVLGALCRPSTARPEDDVEARARRLVAAAAAPGVSR